LSDSFVISGEGFILRNNFCTLQFSLWLNEKNALLLPLSSNFEYIIDLDGNVGNIPSSSQNNPGEILKYFDIGFSYSNINNRIISLQEMFFASYSSSYLIDTERQASHSDLEIFCGSTLPEDIYL